MVAEGSLDPSELISALSRPETYPHPVSEVQVVQTHISIVFLAGQRVYKVKKSLDLGFLDYSTLEKRLALCEAEVTLNRRLAPQVYLGVEPITREPTGELALGGSGQPVEYAVVMKRLPADRTFEALLAHGKLDVDLLRRLADLLARFHADADRSAEIAAFGRLEVVGGNCAENFEQLSSFVGETIHPEVLARLQRATEEALGRLGPLIEARAARGVPCDSHGDLRLEHVYHLPDREPPHDLVAIDCIEFNERFRFGDPIADLAFLVMDLRRADRADLADVLIERYVEASGDAEGRALIPLYTAYRATVRGKVGSFKAAESEVPAPERERARRVAQAHLLFALGALAPPAERPCLVLTAGLPATGKSTVARALAGSEGFTWVRSDVVRKELAGLPPKRSAGGEYEAGIYTPDWTRRTYDECLARAEALLLAGERVVVDACFADGRRRERFLYLARRLGVPFRILLCELDPHVVRERIEARSRQEARDPSDADWEVYKQMANRWQLDPENIENFERYVSSIDTGGTRAETVAAARTALAGLVPDRNGR